MVFELERGMIMKFNKNIAGGILVLAIVGGLLTIKVFDVYAANKPLDNVEVSTMSNTDSIVQSYYKGQESGAYKMLQKKIFKKLLTQWVPSGITNPVYDYSTFSEYHISGSSKNNLYTCAFTADNGKYGFVVVSYDGQSLSNKGVYITTRLYDLNANISAIEKRLNNTSINLSSATASRMRMDDNEVIYFTDSKGQKVVCYLKDLSVEQL